MEDTRTLSDGPRNACLKLHRHGGRERPRVQSNMLLSNQTSHSRDASPSFFDKLCHKIKDEWFENNVSPTKRFGLGEQRNASQKSVESCHKRGHKSVRFGDDLQDDNYKFKINRKKNQQRQMTRSIRSQD